MTARWRPWVFLVATAATLAACARAPTTVPETPEHDTAVPSTEPRAHLDLRLDLAPAQHCEEAFDLQIYKTRGVELVAWDDHRGRCDQRLVTITFVPGQISEQALLGQARRYASTVQRVQHP